MLIYDHFATNVSLPTKKLNFMYHFMAVSPPMCSHFQHLLTNTAFFMTDIFEFK